MLGLGWGGQLRLVCVTPQESNRKVTGISASINHPACEIAKQKHLGEKKLKNLLDHVKGVALRWKSRLCVLAMPQTPSMALGESPNFHLPSYKVSVKCFFSFCLYYLVFLLFLFFLHIKLLGQSIPGTYSS